MIQGLDDWAPQLVLLQTIPGIDRMGAAMLLVEVSAEMQNFGSAERLASWVGICPGCTDMPAMPETLAGGLVGTDDPTQSAIVQYPE